MALGFNPCSNGMKKEYTSSISVFTKTSFNPCSNGMKKERVEVLVGAAQQCVLILVLME